MAFRPSLPVPCLMFPFAVLLGVQPARAGEEVAFQEGAPLSLEEGAPVPLLVVEVRALDPALSEQARALRENLWYSLAALPGMDVHTLDDVPHIGEQVAADYLRDCTTTMLFDCAVLLGQSSGDPLAVLGRLEPREEGLWVDVTLIDTRAGWESMAVVASLEPSEFAFFANQVAGVLHKEAERVLRGPVDRRAGGEPSRRTDAASRSEEARELATYSWDQEGGFVGVSARVREEDRRVTAKDLESGVARDATTPWERLGMSSQTYARYKNSGLSLPEWRARASGRAGQILVRPAFGVVQGPLDQTYVGQLAFDENLDLAEVYEVQNVDGALGGELGLTLGYGFTPAVEARVTASGVWGSYDWEVRQEVEGREPDVDTPPDSIDTFVTQVGGSLRWVPLPDRTVRPAVDVGYAVWVGRAFRPGVQDFQGFGAPIRTGPRVSLGLEARLSDLADAVLEGSGDLLLFGNGPQVLDQALGEITDPVQARSGVGSVAVGLRAGVQFRFGGRDVRGSGELERLELDEPEEDL